MNSSGSFFALRFRSKDTLHKKGDIQYVSDKTLYIGQTEECGLKIAVHPDYADTCYAVIVKNEDGEGWRIIRQEKHANITINGTPLEMVSSLHNLDLLKFDQTVVQFDIGQGTMPTVQYVESKPSWVVWMPLATLLVLAVVAVVLWPSKEEKASDIFKKEIASLCKIEADTLLVLTSQNDTLEVLCPDHSSVGTGFITDDGYFVTARHCVEFWLAYENELRPNLYDIKSPIVRRAIDAEMDTTIHLVAKLTVTSYDGQHVWHVCSDDFTMDKSRDDIYDCGDFETSYLWRSVVSQYEKRDAELGDVAVMKWSICGTIKLEKANVTQKMDTRLYGFGYPQSEGRQEAALSSDEGKVYHDQRDPEECFICEKGFDPGFSGCPVFSAENNHVAVGIVSRSDGRHTLVVPVSQIYHLIKKIHVNEE